MLLQNLFVELLEIVYKNNSLRESVKSEEVVEKLFWGFVGSGFSKTDSNIMKFYTDNIINLKKPLFSMKNLNLMFKFLVASSFKDYLNWGKT